MDFQVGANSIWDTLVNVCGANESGRQDFIEHLRTCGDRMEYRFQGLLGFGGKFYLERTRARVSCYPEDRTPERDRMIEETNRFLDGIFFMKTSA